LYSILILNLLISSFSGKEAYGCCHWRPCLGWGFRACNGI